MKFWKTTEGSESQLLELCFGLFFFYILNGLVVKYFTGPADLGLPNINQIEYLVYSTIGSATLATLVPVLLGWYKLKTNRYVDCKYFRVPIEVFYIIPSGLCNVIVIPTTTMMYLLPISVMVAMVIMRGSIIIVSRIIDEIQIRQGILHKKVYWEEEIAVIFAILAVSSDIFFTEESGTFDFMHSPAALIILGSYITAYFFRLYIMNYFKNTRAKGVQQDNKGYFCIEQITSFTAIMLTGWLIFHFSKHFFIGPMAQYHGAFTTPTSYWPKEIIAGFPYGILAFFSVFLFMYKGRTATFAGLVNRLTTLLAGTFATLIFAFLFHGKYPSIENWVSFVFIIIAIWFLAKADKKRIKELQKLHEIPAQ
jgi:hypothetical protein